MYNVAIITPYEKDFHRCVDLNFDPRFNYHRIDTRPDPNIKWTKIITARHYDEVPFVQSVIDKLVDNIIDYVGVVSIGPIDEHILTDEDYYRLSRPKDARYMVLSRIVVVDKLGRVINAAERSHRNFHQFQVVKKEQRYSRDVEKYVQWRIYEAKKALYNR